MQTTSEVKLIKRHAKSLAKQSTNNTLWLFVYKQTKALRPNKQKRRLCLCCYFVIVIAFGDFKQEFKATAKCSQWRFMDVWIYYVTEGYLVA